MDKQLRNYLLWAFGLAWLVQGLASWFFLRGEMRVYQLLLMLSMFAPLLAALFSRIPLKELGWKPQLRKKWRWLLAAWFGPAALTALGAALFYVLFPASFGGLAATEAVLGEEALAQLAEKGLTVPAYVAITLVSGLVAAPLINTIPSLGEEVGWRGVLYPRLKQRFGTGKGRVLGGAIWGAWHWPVMVLVGYEYGTHYWGSPLSGMLLFCLMCAGLGTLLDFVYEKSGCIWLPALGHGAYNAAASVPLLFTAPGWSTPLLGPLPIGLLAGLPILLLAAALLGKGNAPAD